MIPLNYHHLYYFWVTAKNGSITRASAELLLAQPTLSLQLKQLEKSLGKTLLQRRSDGVGLTPDGQKTFEYCERIFSQGEALLRSLKEGTPASVPVLRVGVSPAVTRQVTLRVFDAVAELSPAVRATVFSGPDADLQNRLSRHTLDLVITHFDLSQSLGKDYRGRLVAEIPVSFVCSPALKKSLRRFPPKGRTMPLLLRDPENPLRKDVEGYLARRRIPVDIIAETEDGYLLRVMAAQGRGVAAINELAYENNMKEGVLVRLNTEPTGIKELVWFTAGTHPHPEPGLRGVLENLMSRFRIKA